MAGETVNSKITWTILGFVASLLMLGISILFNKIGTNELNINQVRIEVATLTNKVSNLDNTTQAMSRDQVSLVSGLSELRITVSNIKLQHDYLKEQFNQLRANTNNGKSIGP